MKHLFISLALISFTSISHALNVSLYCEHDNYTFLSLEIRDDSFEFKHGLTHWKSLVSEDFKTNELKEDEFTIKVYDDKNQNIYMFNKFTNHLMLHKNNGKTYERLKESNATMFGGNVGYGCFEK
jgi:hypothetical protein